MEDVTVTPSRESCVWDTKTKDAILKKYEGLSRSAETIINNTLNNLSLVDWIKTCTSISTLNGGDTKEMKIISQLSALTGFSSLAIEYKKTGIKYHGSIDKMFSTSLLDVTRVHQLNDYNRVKRAYVDVIKYSTNVSESAAFSNREIYLQHGPSELLKSAYICSKNPSYGKDFILLRPKAKAGEDYKELMANFIQGKCTLTEVLPLISDLTGVTIIEDPAKRKEKIREYTQAFTIVNLLLEEKASVYDNVVVPPEFKTSSITDGLDEPAAATEDPVVVAKVDLNKLRKLTGKILIQYPRIDYNSDIVTSKVEMKPVELADCPDDIVYGTREDLELLHFLYVVTRENKNINDSYNKVFSGNPRVCVVSKQVEKHFKAFTPVDEYLFGKDGKTICTPLKKIFTAKILSDWFRSSHNYLSKLSEFSPSLAKTYADIKTYINDNSRPYGFSRYLNLLPAPQREFLEKSTKIQTILLEKGGEVALAFQTDKYLDEDFMTTSVFEDDVIEKAKWILDFDKVFGTLFSEIDSLTTYSKVISPSLAMEIKTIIEARKDRLEQDYPDLCC